VGDSRGRLAVSSRKFVPHVGVVAYIVLDDFGKAGRVYREAAEATKPGVTLANDMARNAYWTTADKLPFLHGLQQAPTPPSNPSSMIC
jgi:hypothetical protein